MHSLIGIFISRSDGKNRNTVELKSYTYLWNQCFYIYINTNYFTVHIVNKLRNAKLLADQMDYALLRHKVVILHIAFFYSDAIISQYFKITLKVESSLTNLILTWLTHSILASSKTYRQIPLQIARARSTKHKKQPWLLWDGITIHEILIMAK